MLNIEDLKVGDELEFISDKDREEFIGKDEVNSHIASLINPSNTVKSTYENYLYLNGNLPHYDLNKILKSELKYFRKVEENKEVVDTPEIDTTYVNAGIKSTKEMYTRLLEGEVFYFEDVELSFDGKLFPFTLSIIGSQMVDYYAEFEVKKPWYEFASEKNPILCKVWNNDSDGCYFYNIESFHKGTLTFIDTECCSWDNATPVKPSECFQGG